MSNSVSSSDDELRAMLKEESDLGLLKFMAGDARDWADAAFCVFCDRHKNYLWTVCCNAAESLHGEAWIEDIFHETFHRAYLKAGAFTLPPGVTPEQAPRCVLGWLGAIASNLLRSRMRNSWRERTGNDDQWEELAQKQAVADMLVTPTPAPDPDLALIEEGLENLSEREALVLRTTFQFYRLGKRFQRLPNRVSEDLAEKLNTTPENLRKIRERALVKLRQYVRMRRSGGAVQNL